MYSLFHHDPKTEYGIVHLAEWKYLRDGLQRNIDTLVNYYNHAPHSVAPDHLLVRILLSIGVPMSLAIDRYYSNVAPLVYTMAGALQLTSSVNTGKIWNGTFYGKGNKEVIISIDEYFDPIVADKNWANLVPVRVLRHPFTDLEMNLPDGRIKSREQGVAVIAVNIPLFAVMHRAFAIEERRKESVDPNYVACNTMQFIAMYVLPNMMGSHVDYALFNRINHMHNGWPLSKVKSHHPFVLIDYSKGVTTIQERLLGLLAKGSYSFSMTLAAIPAVAKENMEKALLMPDEVPTRQVLWAIILARIPVLLFLINTARGYGSRRDQAEVDRIGETLAKLKRQKVFESTLPAEVYNSTTRIINAIIDKTQFTQY